MKVRELRKAIEDLPDDMEVVVIGHFGEAIRVPDYDTPRVVEGPVHIQDDWYLPSKGAITPYAVLAMPKVDIGPEPE